MRKIVVLVLAVAMLLGALVVPAAAAPSSGCKGVQNAQTKANAKAQGALAAVAEKLGCTPTPPPPADPLACPDGTSNLGTFSWDGTTYVADGATGIWVMYGDQNGSYWGVNSGPTPTVIVLEGADGTVIQHAAADPFNRNWFPVVDDSRTTIATVRFCG